MIQVLKRLVPTAVKKSLKHFMGFKSMESRLLNLRDAGFHCTGAVDVGAYHGDWTNTVRSIWNIPVLMVEPQPDCNPILERFTRQPGNGAVHLETCALGKATGMVAFVLDETNSRIAQHGERIDASVATVPVKTLQELVSARPEHYNLLKLDVQGHELEVIEGAGSLLDHFEVIVMEVSIIRIGPVPTFFEAMQYMDGKGYRLYDFLPMYYRPLDNALWQGDAFFVRNDSRLVSSLNWN